MATLFLKADIKKGKPGKEESFSSGRSFLPAVSFVASTFFREQAEEFITEHFWGHSSIGAGRTAESQVAHPRCDIYDVQNYRIECDFGTLYGAAFAALEGLRPQSVFLAEGSAVDVYGKKNV